VKKARYRPPALLLPAVLFASGCALFNDKPEDEPGNLLINGSFEMWGESGPFGWEILQKGENERIESEGAAFHGKIAAGITCLHPAEFVILRQVVPAEKPGLYRARIFVRPALPLRDSYLVVDCLDAAGKRLDVRIRPIQGQLAEWRPVVCDMVVPAGTAGVRVEIRIGPNAAGQVSKDAARLDRHKTAP